MRFGIEKSTTTTDDLGSTITIMRKIRDYEVMKTYKQIKNRVKVRDAKEEMAEYLKHTDKIREKKDLGILLATDRDDPTLVPAFTIEYPKHNVDGTYFVVSSWTEIV